MAWWRSIMGMADSRYGWEEEFFQQQDTIQQALLSLRALALQRASFTSSAVSIHKVRVSEVGVPRHSWQAPGIIQGGGASPNLSGIVGLMVRLAAGERGIHRREYHLRGLPQNFFSGQTQVAPQYQPGLSSYLAALRAGNWCMKVNAMLGNEVPIIELGAWTLEGGNLVGIPILGQPLVDGGTLVYARTDQGVQPLADRVRVRTVRVSPNTNSNRRAVNGVFPVVLQDGSGVYWQSGVAMFDWQGGGLVQLQGESFEPITDTTIRGQAVRKTGPAPKGFGAGSAAGLPTSPASFPESNPLAGLPPGSSIQVWNWSTTRTLNNMQDAVKLNFEGYDPDPSGVLRPIAIAPLVDYPHTWLVSAAGVNRAAQNNQTLWNGFLSGLNLLHPYRDDCTNAVGLTIPAGDTILWHGHSMGGIVGQNLAADQGFTASWPIAAVLTWGSPTSAPTNPGTVYFRFSEPEDLVSVDVGALLTLKGRSQKPQILCVPEPPDLPKFDQHNNYDQSPTLLDVKPWAGLSSPAPGDVLRLGPIQRFAAPM